MLVVSILLVDEVKLTTLSPFFPNPSNKSYNSQILWEKLNPWSLSPFFQLYH